MKRHDIKKGDTVMRDNLVGLDVPTKKKLLRMRNKSKRALNTVVGVVRRIERNGKFAHVKWLGRSRSSREPMEKLTSIKRRGKPRA